MHHRPNKYFDARQNTARQHQGVPRAADPLHQEARSAAEVDWLAKKAQRTHQPTTAQYRQQPENYQQSETTNFCRLPVTQIGHQRIVEHPPTMGLSPTMGLPTARIADTPGTANGLAEGLRFLSKYLDKIPQQELMAALNINNCQLKAAMEYLLDQLCAKHSMSNTSMMLQQQAASVSLVHEVTASQPFIEHNVTEMDNRLVSPSYEPQRPATHVSIYPTELAATGRRKALLIGCNYIGTSNQLNGCISDVNRMKKVLCNVYGFPDSSSFVTTLTDDPNGDRRLMPSKANIIGALQWLVKDARPGDVLFFQFSGHGSNQRNLSNTEADGYDETILPLDYKRAGVITDDDLNRYLIAPLCSGVKLVCVMDCCHSGSGLDLPFFWNRGRWQEESYPKHTEGDVMLISSCQDSETAADVMVPGWGSGGAVSIGIITALMDSDNPHDMTVDQLMSKLGQFLNDRKFKQNPQLSSSQKFNPVTRSFDFQHIIDNMNPVIGGDNRRPVGRNRRRYQYQN
ncbi:metacaspase [Gregarina niphandrodes]|uniref:Metacaspase n=1 Tax=Gregarina niphandrodes TaxID=110365 RepID=A0A023B2B8_GRENI|nr:metacaspase [Gregarina niphandrodes]EZG52125.1 metacaspase [Gregarina niphandrodes]|eukprot:XP_011131900.1 metacaspase [Gregarina niphandrodes]